MIKINCHKCNKNIYIYPYRIKKTKSFSCSKCWNRKERKLNNKEIEKIYLSGKSCREIAKLMKVNSETIRRRLIKMDIKRKTISYYMKDAKHPQYLKNIDDDIIKKLYINQRLSSNRIAQELNISPATVLQRLKKNKIKIRNISECSKLSMTPEKILFLRRRNLLKGMKPPIFKGHTF